MKVFANHEKNSATVSQIEGIFVITVFRNQKHSHATKDGRGHTA